MRRHPSFALAVAPAIAAALYLAAHPLAPDFFSAWLQGERGIVELGTALLFLAAAATAAAAAWQPCPSPMRAWLMTFSGVCAFVSLEEVSYGQALFSWGSPSFFLDHNLQGETNLHNLAGSQPGRTLHRIADVGSMLAFWVLPAIRRFRPDAFGSSAVIEFAWRLVPGFELAGLVLVARTVGFLKDFDLAPDLNELREFLWAWTALGYAAILRDRSR